MQGADTLHPVLAIDQTGLPPDPPPCSMPPLCLQALVLHLLVERARGVASRWAPYLVLLPPQVGKT
jgi:hypothetical protein